MSEEVYRSRTILNQLGGQGPLMAMTGAKNFLVLRNGIQFDLPSRFARGGINLVQITLNEGDLYDVAFLKYSRRSMRCEEVETLSDVYADDLVSVFQETTGLDLRIPQIMRQQTPKNNIG